ncbi:MAG: hypothetical protein ABSH52_09275 [Terriglobia bacterium]|jgi:hypothetical protein
MATHSNLSNIRDEVEAETTWRTYSRHIIAHLLEGCAKCGTVREKEHLTQLPRSKGFFGQFRRVMLLFAALVPFQA